MTKQLQNPSTFLSQSNIKRSFELFGLLLSALGIAFALEAFFEFQTLKRKTEAAVAASTTHSVGNFPSNLAAVTQVMQSSCYDLVIMTDVPAYGMYSSPEDFEHYLLAIEQAANLRSEETRKTSACVGVPKQHSTDTRVNVWMIVYDEPRLREALRNQFKDKEYPKISSDEKFGAYFARHQELKRPETYPEFIDALAKAHLGYEQELTKHGVKLRFSNHRYSIYFWMHDSVDSAFSLDYQGDFAGDVEREIGFTSRDDKMTDALTDIFCLEWRKAGGLDDEPAFCKKHPASAASP